MASQSHRGEANALSERLVVSERSESNQASRRAVLCSSKYTRKSYLSMFEDFVGELPVFARELGSPAILGSDGTFFLSPAFDTVNFEYLSLIFVG